MPEEEKKAVPQRRVRKDKNLVQCDEADPRPFMFYDVDVRKPKQRASNKKVRKPVHGIQFLSECSNDSGDRSFNNLKKRSNLRVASN